MIDVVLAEEIHGRMNVVMVHAHIYYLYNASVISDERFDRYAKELAEMIEKYPKESAESPLYKHFKGFDGSTAYHVVDARSKQSDIARLVIDAYINEE